MDFILGDHTAVEVKAKHSLSVGGLKSLRALAEEDRSKRFVCVRLEPRPRRLAEVDILPLPHFLEALWAGEYA